MSNMNPLLERNKDFAGSGSHDGLAPVPARGLVVVTCMDARVDPAHVLGVELGDALVIRNSGGRVTPDVLESLAFVGALTEAMFGADAPAIEVAVIHHTGCGSAMLANPEFAHRFATHVGHPPHDIAASAVTDPFESVQHDVGVAVNSPLRPAFLSVSGHVYDLDTGIVTTTVDSTTAAHSQAD